MTHHAFDLAKARAELGWQQWRLADELGVNQATISRWEADASLVPLMARKLIEQAIAEKRATAEAAE